MTSSYGCIILESPHSSDYRAFYWNFDEPKILMQETIIAIQDRCSTQHRRSQGGLKVHVPPKFLEHIIILWLERRFPKQNSVIRLKSNILPTPNFFASPKFLGWLRSCHTTWGLSSQYTGSRICFSSNQTVLYEMLWRGCLSLFSHINHPLSPNKRDLY